MAKAGSLRVMLGGGSGFVGRALSHNLRQRGHTVTVVSRSEGEGRVTWDELETSGLPECDAVVNLSGAGILDPLKWWGDAYKKTCWDSRIDTTRALVSAIQKADAPPGVFVSASGISCYPAGSGGDLPDHDETTDAPWPTDYMGRLQLAWEDESKPLEGSGTRRVIVRTGVVLGSGGGAVQQMLLPFKLCLGGPIAGGAQPFPWVHLDDVVGVYTHAIEEEAVRGVVNATAPARTTNYEFTKALGGALGRPTFIPAPGFVLNTMLGADRAVLLTEGAFATPRRTQELGYTFKFDDIAACMGNIVGGCQ